ncbi:glycosyltransferase [Methylobacterium sp. DB0501]|nr:glycosyltransferase [Methylobacterium sp. DB0501]
MVVRNEAPIIRACLESLRPLIDAWVVVDTGSTDGTQDIVRRALADLPGTLSERPWRGFAETRSEALDLARRHGRYSLVVEAGDRLDAPPGYALPALTADGYTLGVASGASLCRRLQLLRSALPWRYDGAIHESLGCEEAGTLAHLPGPVLRAGPEWGRAPGTDRLDPVVIARALADAPTPLLAARYTFHLAQRHRDRGETDAAIARFLERADQGFAREEVYVSLLEAGRHRLLAGRPLAEVLAPLERAMALRPRRAEAPHAASAACRMHAEHRRGTGYAKAAAAMPMPGRGLFLERWIYEYGALDEYAINAYWSGDVRDSLDAGLRALASGAVPDDQRARFLANARFALDRLDRGMAASANGDHALTIPRSLDAALPEPEPRVLLAILAGNRDTVLPLFLDCIDALDYPKSAIVLYVRIVDGSDRTRDILDAWLARVGGDYAAIDQDGAEACDPAKNLGRAKDLGLTATTRHGCAYYFTAECDNLIRPCTLRNLVATGLPIVAPLLRHVEPAQLFSNYHAAVDEAGYFKDGDLYEPVLFRHVTGLIEMPVVRCTYLVRADVIPRLGHTDGTDALDYVIFSRRARAAGIVQYFDNRQIYGYIAMEDGDPALTDERVRQARRLLGLESGTPAA